MARVGGSRDCLSLEICLHGEESTSSLSRWWERQASILGREWGPEGLPSQEDTVRPWPHLSQDHSICLPSQILAHNLVEFRVLPLAPWDPLVMDRPWVRVRASEQAELWIEKG